jgi:hypothetical protein
VPRLCTVTVTVSGSLPAMPSVIGALHTSYVIFCALERRFGALDASSVRITASRVTFARMEAAAIAEWWLLPFKIRL